VVQPPQDVTARFDDSVCHWLCQWNEVTLAEPVAHLYMTFSDGWNTPPISPMSESDMLPRICISFRQLARACGILLLVIAEPAYAPTLADPHPSDSFFGMTKVSEIHIQFEPDQWQAIQPPDDVNWDVNKAFGDLISDAMAGKHFHSEKSSRPGLAGQHGGVVLGSVCRFP